MKEENHDTSKVLKEHTRYFNNLMVEKEKIIDKLKSIESKLQRLKEQEQTPDKKDKG